MKRIVLATILLACISYPASARSHHRHHHSHHRGHHSVSHHGVPWCGQWMSENIFGRSIRKLWIAANWASVGSAAPGPAPDVIGVKRHHVFKVIRVVAPGRVLAISGNDGGRVRTRVRSTAGVIAWRTP